MSAPGRPFVWKHGKTISKDGELRFLSVSQLELADSSSDTGCERKWFYDRKLGIKDNQQSDALDRGNECHAQVEHHLKTGDRAHLGPIVLRGMHMIPAPGPDLGVELDIVPDLPNGKSGLSVAPMRVAGIPLTGKIDLLHWRPENPGVMDITQATDPLGILKLTDWKYPNKMDRALLDHQLADELQMCGYSLWGFNVYPSVEQIRISHGYMPVKGQPRLATALVDRDRVTKTWRKGEAIARSLKDIARETDPDKVPANTNACNAYYRQCPAWSVCSAGGASKGDEFGLSHHLGEAAAAQIVPPSALIRKRDEDQPRYPDTNMATTQPPNVFAYVQGAGVPAPQPGIPPQFNPYAAPAAPVYAPPAPPAAPSPDVVAAELARLAAQEHAAQMQAAQAAAAVPAPAAPSPTLALIQEIQSFGLGMPEFTGFAAGEVGKLFSVVPTPRGADHFLPGSGAFAGHSIADTKMLVRVLDDLKRTQPQRAAAQAPAPPVASPAPVAPVPAPTAPSAPAAPPMSITPPEPPAIAALAQVSAGPEEAAAKKAAKEAEKAAKKAAKEAEKAAEKAAAKAAKDAAAPVAPTPAAPTPEPTPAAAPAPEPAPSPAPVAPATGLAPAPTAAPIPGAVNFYLNCEVDGLNAQAFRSMADYIVTSLNTAAGAADFRDVPKDSRFAFSGWRIITAATVRDLHAKGHMPAGNYTFSALGEIDCEIALAMRDLARNTGGAFVRGAR